MNPLTHSKNTTILPILIALTLGCFGLSPQARGVCQEGCLTNSNTVLGDDALLNNTGISNTATGFQALINNTTGDFNTAIGWEALLSNTTGIYNVAVGAGTLSGDATGIANTAIGQGAMTYSSGDYNTAIGVVALLFSSGNNNIALGSNAGVNLTAGDNNICIGNFGAAGESGTIRIGTNGTHNNVAIAGIYGTTIPTGVRAIVSPGGRLGVVTSSARFKDAIKPMDKASEAILALKPVSFCYKREIDPEGIPQFGLVAEDVEKVNPDLVARDDQGRPYSVRYEAVDAMLLNEFLKEHRAVEEQKRKIQEQEATITQLKSALAKQATVDAHQQKQIEALTAGLQKVSAQIELSKPALRTVLDNQ
jgi:uncharacterized coiled-coil protein SlyX